MQPLSASLACPKCGCPTRMDIGTRWNEGVQRVICICQAQQAPSPHARCRFRMKRLVSSYLDREDIGQLRSTYQMRHPGPFAGKR